jgi:6-phosphogluconolactonase
MSTAAVLLLSAVAWPDPPPGKEKKIEKLWVYVGTYTGEKSKGIYRFEMDPATGQLTSGKLVAESASPSFLAVDPNLHFLYAVNEVTDFKGKKSGAVSAYALDTKTGDLTFLNQQPTGGDGPCHLVVDGVSKHVLVANYGGGSTCVLPIKPDGSLGEATAFQQHAGSSVNKERQEGPHAHCVTLDTANRFAIVADLGLDQVLVYRFDTTKGTLVPNFPPAASLAPGSGPRHFAFHPDGHKAYVINELDSTLTAFEYDDKRGILKKVQTLSTLPKGFSGDNSTAEVQVHPSGKFVYGSNRGHNSIVIYAVDPQTGTLSLVGHQTKGIKTPRNFSIDPTGAFLIVANQDADNLVVFRIDTKTGELTPTDHMVEVGKPVCVTMLPKAQ